MLQRLNARRTQRLTITATFVVFLGACTASQYSVEDDSSGPTNESHFVRDAAASETKTPADDDDTTTDSASPISGDDSSTSTDLDAEIPSDSAAVADGGNIVADSGVVALTSLITVPRPGGGASFSIESREVSQKQYQAFLLAKANDTSGQIAKCASNLNYTPQKLWNPAGTPNRPVVGVDWCDARAYCAWAGRNLCGAFGGTPLANLTDAVDATKSEWAAACTKGGIQTFPYGTKNDDTACNILAGAPTSADDVATNAKCVGGYSGIYDLVGNVSEWVDACGSDGSCAIIGGSWGSGTSPVGCGVLFGGAGTSNFQDLGFRCCKN